MTPLAVCPLKFSGLPALLVLGTVLFPACLAQSNSGDLAEKANASSAPPVAFVYVSYTSSSDQKGRIAEWAAALDGRLTPVAGTPFHADVDEMVVNGKYLFGSTQNGIYIAAFQIGANGALHWTTSTDIAQYNPSGCYGPNPLVLDHTGANLYMAERLGVSCDSNAYQSFTIDKSNGRLQFLGTSSEVPLFDNPLRFSGNNRFVYGGQCFFGSTVSDSVAGLTRYSDGFLNYNQVQIPTIAAKTTTDVYCRGPVAADTTNHVAMSMIPINVNADQQDGLPQLATFTADSNGNLTTNSTYANMATTLIGIVNINMSPSGKLLAVAGSGGVQIFHFNGAAPLTPEGGLLTTHFIETTYWDNADHLYGISPDGLLYVFTVTPTTMSEAPGSPYGVPSTPRGSSVQPKTKLIP